MLDTAGAGVKPRKNFPAAYTPSFRWPVLPSGDAPCLLGWEHSWPECTAFCFSSSIAGLLSLGTADAWGWTILGWGGMSCTLLDIRQHPWPVPNRRP